MSYASRQRRKGFIPYADWVMEAMAREEVARWERPKLCAQLADRLRKICAKKGERDGRSTTQK